MADQNDDEDAETEDTPGPTGATDPATKADMGLSGSPEESYSPAGMGEDIDGEGGE